MCCSISTSNAETFRSTENPSLLEVNPNSPSPRSHQWPLIYCLMDLALLNISYTCHYYNTSPSKLKYFSWFGHDITCNILCYGSKIFHCINTYSSDDEKLGYFHWGVVTKATMNIHVGYTWTYFHHFHPSWSRYRGSDIALHSKGQVGGKWG